jgi:hypothetical protein
MGVLEKERLRDSATVPSNVLDFLTQACYYF